MTSLHTLLNGAIDYAGLFPPAKLDMHTAAQNYALYKDGEHAWALGRFIVPAARLAECERALAGLQARTADPWRLSALVGTDIGNDLAAINAFNTASGRRTGPPAVVDTIEAIASTAGEVTDLAHAIPRSLQTFIEIPLDPDPAGLLETIDAAGVRAKVRTGGVTPDAFPSGANLARFLDRCVRSKVAFKATAGLHHPLRAQYRLTYEADSLLGTMFGFLNVFVAAAVAFTGGLTSEIEEALSEGSTSAFHFSDTAMSWRDFRVDSAAIEVFRKNCAVSFGSCSFTEPVDELTSLRLL